MARMKVNQEIHRSDSSYPQKAFKQPHQGWLILLVIVNVVLMVFLLLSLFQHPVEANYIYVGRQSELVVSEIFPEDRILIPKGYPLRDGEVNEIIISFHVIYEEESIVRIQVRESSKVIGTLIHSFHDLLIIQLYERVPHEDELNHLQLDLPLALGDDQPAYSNPFFLKLFLTNPPAEFADEAYDAIAGQSISFTLDVSVVQDA